MTRSFDGTAVDVGWLDHLCRRRSGRPRRATPRAFVSTPSTRRTWRSTWRSLPTTNGEKFTPLRGIASGGRARARHGARRMTTYSATARTTSPSPRSVTSPPGPFPTGIPTPRWPRWPFAPARRERLAGGIMGQLPTRRRRAWAGSTSDDEELFATVFIGRGDGNDRSVFVTLSSGSFPSDEGDAT